MDQEKKPVESPDQLHRFRELVFDLLAKMIGKPPSEIDREIENSLRVVRNFWNFDATGLGTLSENGDIVNRISSAGPGMEGLPPVVTQAEAPRLADPLGAGVMVSWEKLPDDLPKHSERDRDFFRQRGIKSLLALPFRSVTSPQWVFTDVSCTEYQTWPPDLVAALQHFVDMLAGSLDQKRIMVRVEELLRFERTLSEVSATYINLPSHRFDAAIKNDLGRLGRLLGVDRIILYSLLAEGGEAQWNDRFSWWPAEDDRRMRDINQWRETVPEFLDNFRYAYHRWERGEIVRFTRPDELPDEANPMKETMARLGIKSYLSIPISVVGSITDVLGIATIKSHREWPEDLVQRLRLFGEVFANAILRKGQDEQIRSSFIEIKQLKERIEADYTYLQEEINLEHGFGGIVGESGALRQALYKVRQVAPTGTTVLLMGETGTGKGLIARALHNASRCKDRPLIQVNCAALTPSLIESELFGHEKGAFTGATGRRIGRFEAAKGTTLFLDEIGELPLELQPKLLRVLQDGEFERVGGTATLKTDARVIAATNRDLEAEVEKGRFRRDLWYRLSIFPIFIPPLRERQEDIPLFVSTFVKKHAAWVGKHFDRAPQKTIRALQRYDWPGNIRELGNLIERAVITSPDGELRIELPARKDPFADTGRTLGEFERDYIFRILEETGWIIEGPSGAALRLGMKPSTLRLRMKKHGIRRPAGKTR
jgi:transcriptional regulator with GAF, ATPase, and Fis domain